MALVCWRRRKDAPSRALALGGRWICRAQMSPSGAAVRLFGRRQCAELASRGGRVSREGGHVQQLHDGQCGLCVHFGETHPRAEQLIAIRRKHEAPEVLVDECGHPRHASLHKGRIGSAR